MDNALMPLLPARSPDTGTALKGSSLYTDQIQFLTRPMDNTPSDTGTSLAPNGKLGADDEPHKGVPYPPLADIPPAFDGVAEWQDDYLPPMPQLGQCAASWAAAAAYALTARYRLWTKNQLRGVRNKRLNLSYSKVAQCNYGSVREYKILSTAMREDKEYRGAIDRLYDGDSVGCDHVETLLGAWQYLLRFGAVDAGCISNTDFGDQTCEAVLGPALGRCADGARGDSPGSAGAPAKLYKADGFYTLPAQEGAIRQEVFKWGPVTSAMEVTDDLDRYAHSYTHSYTNGTGVYSPPPLNLDPDKPRSDLVPRANDAQRRRDRVEEATRGLSVVIVGWGGGDAVATTNDTVGDAVVTKGNPDVVEPPYWIVAAWDRGFMRVARGVNAGGIEANAIAGFPAIPMAKMFMPYTSMDSEIDTFVANIWPIHPSGYKDTVIEEELLKGRDITRDTPDIVSEDMIPDYHTMVAADPLTITFPYRGNIWREHPEVYYLLLVVLLVAVIVAGVWAITA